MEMLVHVYRRRDCDCSNGGVSRTNDTLLVVERDAAAPANPTLPVMVLEARAPSAVFLQPVKSMWEKNRNAPMAGGNYAVGDRRFDEAVERLLGTKFCGAVAIHDRFESQEMSDQLGR